MSKLMQPLLFSGLETFLKDIKICKDQISNEPYLYIYAKKTNKTTHHKQNQRKLNFNRRNKHKRNENQTPLQKSLAV